MQDRRTDILLHKNWLYFKLYKNPYEEIDWKLQLDWYHKVLREVVRPTVESEQGIQALFFSIYGPRPYELEDGEMYERVISPPATNVVFIRLRLCVTPTRKNKVKDLFLARMNSRKDIVWDYDILRGYKVLDDLGNRYGKTASGMIDDERTRRFIRYWDSACRYILSILAEEGNWEETVDVWGVPHLVNNSLGCWLRPTGAKCPKCERLMYMATTPIQLPTQLLSVLARVKSVPIFLFICPRCKATEIGSTNI